ncbi:hypothetical protein MMC18_002616 [Xylographa bjoerkii]|nr:hypothetical protein [Xylographa bjoerkii]
MPIAHQYPPHIFPPPQVKHPASPLRTPAESPPVNFVMPISSVKSSRAPVSKASPTSMLNGASPATSNKTIVNGVVSKHPAESAPGSAAPATALEVLPLTSSKDPHSTLIPKASPASAPSSSSKAPTAHVPSIVKGIPGRSTTSLDGTQTHKLEHPTAALTSSAALAEMTVSKHGALLAYHLQQVAIHNQHALSKLSAAVYANKSVVAQAVGTLSQMNPTVASALGSAVTQATGALSHVSPTAGSILDTAAAQAAGVPTPTLPAAATLLGDGVPSLGESSALGQTSAHGVVDAPADASLIVDAAPEAAAVTTDAVVDTPADSNSVVNGAPEAAAPATDVTTAPGGSDSTNKTSEEASHLTNGTAEASGTADPMVDTSSEVALQTDNVPQANGQEGQSGAKNDALAEEAAEISLLITPLSQEDKVAAIDKDTSEFLVEGTLTKFDDPTGAAPDVAIITPTHTFECHMSKLASVTFFKEVDEAARAEDPPLSQPIRYQFVVVGGETWSIQPLANHPTDETRAWDTLNDASKEAIFNELDLFLKISYGKRPAIASYAEIDEIYSTLKAFGTDVPSMNNIISACLAKAKPELGNDIVEYPAAFLEIAQAIGNRQLYLDSLSHVVGRMVFHNLTWDNITTHYPNLAGMEAIATKYSAALKSRIEALIALMGKFIWPSIVQTFTAETEQGKFAEIRDPKPSMIRPELTMAELIAGMKAYRSCMSIELGRNGRGGGYTALSGRDAQGGHKKLDYFTAMPIKEHDDNEQDVGISFAEFTADFEHLT